MAFGAQSPWCSSAPHEDCTVPLVLALGKSGLIRSLFAHGSEMATACMSQREALWAQGKQSTISLAWLHDNVPNWLCADVPG